MGDWTNGFAFCVRDGRLVFLLNRAGDDAGRERHRGPGRPARARVPARAQLGGDPVITLLHDDVVVASVAIPVGVPFVWQHGGTALRLGSDNGFPVCDDYELPFAWNGVLHEVVVDIGADAMPADPAWRSPSGSSCTASSSTRRS